MGFWGFGVLGFWGWKRTPARQSRLRPSAEARARTALLAEPRVDARPWMWAQRPRSGAQVRAKDVSRRRAPRCHFAGAHPDDMASGGGAMKVTEPLSAADKSGAAAAAKVRRAKASFSAVASRADASDGRSAAAARARSSRPRARRRCGCSPCRS